MFTATEIEDSTPEYANNTVVIDADEVAYVCAAGNETRGIRVREKMGFAPWLEYNTRTEFYAAIGGKHNADTFVIEDVQYPFHIDKCYKKIDEFVESILERCQTDKYLMFMGSGSPRDAIATVQVYKGQRGDILRPKQLKQARQYCIDKWGAVEVDGKKYEADDMVSIYQSRYGYIGATQDKDAYQVEGWLLKPGWNAPRKLDGFGFVDIDRSGKTPIVFGEGECFLAYQVLVGDSTDNYKPTFLNKKRFGAVGAKKLIDLCKDAEDLWATVVDKYKEWYPEPIEYTHAYTGEKMIGTWHSLFNEYYRLAYMLRDFDDINDGYDVLEYLGADW